MRTTPAPKPTTRTRKTGVRRAASAPAKRKPSEPLLVTHLRPGDYRRKPGDTRPTWCLTLEAILDYAGISKDRFADSLTNPKGEVGVARSGIYKMIDGERRALSEAQFQDMADVLGVPRAVLQTMEPEQAIDWIREYVEQDFWGTPPSKLESVQNTLDIAA